MEMDNSVQPCVRCRKLKPSHKARNCSAKLSDSWNAYSNRDACEQLFNEIKARSGGTNVSGSKTGKTNSRQKPASGTKNSGVSTNRTIAGGSTNSGNNIKSKDSGNDGNGSEESRKAISDDKTGTLEPLGPSDTNSENAPHSNLGVTNVFSNRNNTVDIVSKEGFKILSNHVRVTRIPDSLYTYSLKFWHPRASNSDNPGANPKEEVVDRRRDIKSAFDALTGIDRPQRAQADEIAWPIGRDGFIWATDYKDLWCTTKLPDQTSAPLNTAGSTSQSPAPISLDPTTPSTETILTFGPCKWDPPGARKPVDDLHVTVSNGERVRNLRKAFEEENADAMTEKIRALNAIIARSVLKGKSTTHVTQIGANKFYLDRGFAPLNGMHFQRGYFSSIRPSKLGPLLNVNTATAAFLPQKRVSEFALSLQAVGCTDWGYIEKLLHGCVVRIMYRRPCFEGGADMNTEANRRKPFQQFGSTTSRQTFYKFLPKKSDEDQKKQKKKKGKRETDPDDKGTTVFDFFTKQVQLSPEVVQEVTQDTLCVNVGKKVNLSKSMRAQCEDGAIWIPASLLEILPNQPTKAFPLDSYHTENMMAQAVRQPNMNLCLIVDEGLIKLGIRGDQRYLNEMGVVSSKSLVKFPASRLSPPTILYDRRRIPPTDASWNLVNVRFCQSPPLKRLCVLGLRNSLHPHQINLLADNMELRIRDHGTTLEEQNFVRLQALHEKIEDFLLWSAETDMTMVVLPSTDDLTYSRIKRTYDYSGLPVLCLQSSKVSRALNREPPQNSPAQVRDSYTKGQRNLSMLLSNLCLKVNLKQGGTNHTLNIRGLTPGEMAHTIVLGADVTHPPMNAVRGYPSIACVVGSLDCTLMNYPGSMRLQANRQEYIEDMASMVTDRLEAWGRNNSNKIPDNILFYRDGISESQFEACKTREIQAIRSAYHALCKKHGTQKDLKLTFVVAGKRHNTRFFPTALNQVVDSRPNRVNMNLKPGLLVDGYVTDPGHTNFYLQSHNAIKGTARSAHYHVLENEMNITKLHDLTHDLCYAFGRATKGVSYAAPAYIADRLCERGRVYLKEWRPDDSWNTPVDLNGEPTNDEDEILRWKKGKALELARDSNVWGNYNDNIDPPRLNPWHPNLDNVMFWM